MFPFVEQLLCVCVVYALSVRCSVLREGVPTTPPCVNPPACFLRNLSLSLPHAVSTEKNGFDITGACEMQSGFRFLTLLSDEPDMFPISSGIWILGVNALGASWFGNGHFDG